MEQPLNFEQIFSKLADLKSFFVYGQNLVPIFQKIIDFMQSTVPMMEQANQSILESTSKIPKAAVQLNSVSSATEVATTEILDIVDSLTSEVAEMKTRLLGLKEKLGEDKSVIGAEVDAILSVADKIDTGMLNITISLQVQDITSQQLSSVNHMIQSIQEKLSGLLVDLDNKDPKLVDNSWANEVSKNASFNPEARYDREHTNQNLADNLVNENNTKTASDERASQAEIDKLFAKQ